MRSTVWPAIIRPEEMRDLSTSSVRYSRSVSEKRLMTISIMAPISATNITMMRSEREPKNFFGGCAVLVNGVPAKEVPANGMPAGEVLGVLGALAGSPDGVRGMLGGVLEEVPGGVLSEILAGALGGIAALAAGGMAEAPDSVRGGIAALSVGAPGGSGICEVAGSGAGELAGDTAAWPEVGEV